MGRLTTHVLDTVSGGPAAGVKVELFRIAADGERRLLAATQTNGDGRTDAPLLAGADFAAGTYEIAFHIGPYFQAAGAKVGEPAFLDVVPLRFGLGTEGHYHVPLLCSPWSYSTYRGS